MRVKKIVRLLDGSYALYCPWCGNRCKMYYTPMFLFCEKCGKESVVLTEDDDCSLDKLQDI